MTFVVRVTCHLYGVTVSASISVADAPSGLVTRRFHTSDPGRLPGTAMLRVSSDGLTKLTAVTSGGDP